MKFSMPLSSDVPDQWKSLVLQYCEAQQARGVEFKDGETIQVGWMWFKFKGDSVHLEIQAPKMGKMPMVFESDCSEALHVIMVQGFMAESFGCLQAPCNCRQSAVILKGAKREDGLFMNRQNSLEGNDSGWFIGAEKSTLDPQDSRNLERKSLWEISCLFPETTPFWLMGLDWQILWRNRPVVLRSYEKVSPLVGSFYATKYGCD